MAILVGTASWTDKSLVACKRFYRWSTEDLAN